MDVYASSYLPLIPTLSAFPIFLSFHSQTNVMIASKKFDLSQRRSRKWVPPVLLFDGTLLLVVGSALLILVAGYYMVSGIRWFF